MISNFPNTHIPGERCKDVHYSIVYNRKTEVIKMSNREINRCKNMKYYAPVKTKGLDL